MRSQRHQPSEPIPGQTDRSASWRPGIASRSRDDGQRLALNRADAYRGLPTALPTIDAVCNALHITARRHPPGRMAIETLEILLRLLPRHCWGQQPVLRVTNATLASHLGYCERQAQRHLRALHEHGIVAIDWGRGNTRLRWDVHATHERPNHLPGIDLRPAIVYALEQQELARAIRAARAEFRGEVEPVLDAIAAARRALLTGDNRMAHSRHALLGEHLDQLGHETRRLQRHSLHARATPATIRELAQVLPALAERVRAVSRQIAANSIDKAGGKPEDNEEEMSSRAHQPANQTTDSNYVESVVLTIQEHRRTDGFQGDRAAGEIGGSVEAGPVESGADPAAPLLYDRWLRAQDGSQPLASGDLAELEITARLRASRMGVAARVIEVAAHHHGLPAVIGAILHVDALPGSSQVRSRGALLASLLRRASGELTPASFAGRPRPREPLGEAEALAIARRLAPGHQPHWIRTQWLKTRARRGLPLGDERRCLEGFARKLQREHGGYGGYAD